MLKRVLMIGLALGVIIAVLYVGIAEAQWRYLRPPGMWWYYGSIDGCATITKVRNPDTHPAILRCDIDLTRIESLCYNPNNNDVRPGVAGTRVVVSNPIDQEQLDKKDKKQGKANVCVEVDEKNLGPELLCVNRNWNVIATLTTEFLAACTTEQCTGEDPNPCAETVVKDTQVCKCTLPNFHVEDVWDEDLNPGGALKPCDDPLNPGSDCEPYQCDEVYWDGQDWAPTGRECKFLE